MKRTVFIWCIVTLIFGLNSGCNKKKGCTDPISLNYNSEAEEDDGSCSYAGSGGNTTIVAHPKHHGKAIFSHATYPDTAFVKFNAFDFPGVAPALYDTFYVGEEGENHIHMQALKKGRYYIYITGFDTSINMRVTGGMPYKLYKEAGEVDVNVAVTE